MRTQPERVLVIGFDGLDFRYLDAFSNQLSNFETLRKAGVERRLESTFPPMTPTAWPSFYTGVGPSYHGVYDFFRFNGYPDQGEIVSRNDVRAPALWNYLTETGIPSIVLNVPITYPPEEIEGVIVPGILSPEGPPTYPKHVRAELVEQVGDYYVYPRESGDGSVSKLTGKMRMRGEAAEHLLMEEDWKLGIIEFQSTDSVFHEFDDEADFREVYRLADQLLGRFLKLAGDETAVLVVSDHGIGPMEGWKVNVNTVLDEDGFIEATADSTILSHVDLGESGTTDGAGADGDGALETVVWALSAVGITRPRVAKGLSALRVESFVKEHTPDDLVDLVQEGVDWRRSAAYFARFPQLGVRINLEGREPEGVVPEEQYDTVRERIVRVLRGLETPSGESIFEWVEPREEVYDGPYTGQAADVLFMPTGMDHYLDYQLPLNRTTFEQLDRNHHKSAGVFLADGPGIAAATEDDALSITDIAPAIMALLGQPVPKRMTGTVPEGILTVDYTEQAYPDVEFGATKAVTDDSVTDRLKDLGYL